MFRQSSDAEHEEMSEGGTRYLFQLDHYGFSDTLDGHGYLHFFVVEESDNGPAYYETDQEVMYELMARYLAGVYEKSHYEMERSPTHAALMDVLELATARARSGDPGFAFEDGEDLEEAEEVEEPDGFEDEDPSDFRGT